MLNLPSKEQVERHVTDLQAMSAQIGEHEDFTQEIAGARAQLDVVKRSLEIAKRELAEAQRQRNDIAAKCQDEYTRLIEANAGVQKELTRNRADLEKINAELAVGKVEIEKLRHRFGG
jgi:chromosome segregation ATPase